MRAKGNDMTRIIAALFLQVFLNISVQAAVEPQLLSEQTLDRFKRVPEFKFIREEAEKIGVKVYLFGGTASAFAHYVRWDLEREAGDAKYQPERFDYDFTNIYRGNQDLDIVVDGTPEQADNLRNVLQEKFPHFVGSREAWEVRLLRESRGDKRALLDDFDFLNQHTDSNSTGMLDLTAETGDVVYQDLFSWDKKSSQFLDDISAGRITYYFSKKHKETSRFKEDKNPPLLSVIRYVAKLTQYEVVGSVEDLKVIKKIIKEFSKNISYNDYVRVKAIEFGRKALLNAPDVEYAWNLLEETGLRDLLKSIDGKEEVDSLSWWLNREPLRSFEVGAGTGATAKDIGVEIVAHETRSFAAYENITRSSKGRANVFISRSGKSGEAAIYGDGFYTKIGTTGAVGTGITIRFKLDPRAREGSDFTRASNNFIVVHNKNAIELIQENIDLSLVNYFKLSAAGQISKDDKGLIAKLERRFLRRIVTPEEVVDIAEYLEVAPKTIDLSYNFNLWMRLPESINYPDLIGPLVSSGAGSDKLASEILEHALNLEHWKSLRLSLIQKTILTRNTIRINNFVEYLTNNQVVLTNEELKSVFESLHEVRFLNAESIKLFHSVDFWSENSQLLEVIVNEYHIDSDFVSSVLTIPGISKAVMSGETMDILLAKGNVDLQLIKEVLSKKEWAKYPDIIKRLIDLKMHSQALSQYIYNKPYWFSNIELLSYSLDNGQLRDSVAKIFTHEEWTGNIEIMLKKVTSLGVTARNSSAKSGVVMMAELLANRPKWEKSPELILALLAKNDSNALSILFDLIQNKGWEKYPEVLEAFIPHVSTDKVIKVLSVKPWSKNRDLIEKIVLDKKSDLRSIIGLFKSKDMVGKAELLINFIHLRKDELRSLNRNSWHGREGPSSWLVFLIENVFTHDEWSKYPEVIEAIAPIADPSSETVLIKKVFSKTVWSVEFVKPYIDNYIEVRSVKNLQAIVGFILTRPDWPAKYKTLQYFMGLNIESVDVLIVSTFFKGHWPEHPDLIEKLISRGGTELNNLIVDFLEEGDKYKEYPDYVKQLASQLTVSEKFAKIIFSDTYESELIYWVEKYLDAGTMDNQIVAYALKKAYSLDVGVEWLIRLVGRRDANLDTVLNEFIFSMDEWLKHPVLLKYVDGNKVSILSLRDQMLVQSFQEWYHDYMDVITKPQALSCSLVLSL